MTAPTPIDHRVNRGHFRPGFDPRRHRFTRDERMMGFWAALDSIITRYPDATDSSVATLRRGTGVVLIFRSFVSLRWASVNLLRKKAFTYRKLTFREILFGFLHHLLEKLVEWFHLSTLSSVRESECRIQISSISKFQYFRKKGV